MDKNLFETIDPIVNEIADQLTALIEGDTLSELKQKLADRVGNSACIRSRSK